MIRQIGEKIKAAERAALGLWLSCLNSEIEKEVGHVTPNKRIGPRLNWFILVCLISSVTWFVQNLKSLAILLVFIWYLAKFEVTIAIFCYFNCCK